MMQRLLEIFKDVDIFGHPIKINYRGNDTYKTKLGAFVTILTFALVMFNTIELTQSFLDHSKQEENNQFERYDRYQQS